MRRKSIHYRHGYANAIMGRPSDAPKFHPDAQDYLRGYLDGQATGTIFFGAEVAV